jgi:hypothetical protein
MLRPDFKEFQSHLRDSGVACRHADRITTELRDHFEDLVDDALISGVDVATANHNACESLGDLRSIALDICSRPELSSWAFRHPRLALIAYPLLCAAVMPAVPVIAGVAHASLLARWGVSLFFGGIATAAILLAMQLSITLT